MTDIQKFREEFALEVWTRIAQNHDTKGLKETIEERLIFLNKLETSTDPLIQLAYLCETQIYDAAIVKAANFQVGKSHSQRDVFDAFCAVYPSIKEQLLAGIK